MKQLEFQNKKITIYGESFQLDYNILDARIIKNLAVVIYKFDNLAPKHRQFNNCQAFNSEGKLIWTAEHPTTTTSDFYVEFMDSKKNRLWNFGCYICKLDFKSGKLLKADFTK